MEEEEEEEEEKHYVTAYYNYSNTDYKTSYYALERSTSSPFTAVRKQAQL